MFTEYERGDSDPMASDGRCNVNTHEINDYKWIQMTFWQGKYEALYTRWPVDSALIKPWNRVEDQPMGRR